MPDPSAVGYSPSGAVFVVDGSQGVAPGWSNGSLSTVATGSADLVGVADGAGQQDWVDIADGGSFW